MGACSTHWFHYPVQYLAWFNTLRPRQNSRHFAEAIFKCIFTPRPFRLKGYCRCLRLSVCPSVHELSLVRTIIRHIFELESPNLHPGILLAGIENRGHWPWPSRSLSPPPPASTKLKGGILVAPCSSVRLWTESCPLCIFNNTGRIHFIFAHLIKQLQKVWCEFKNSQIWNFGKFFKFVSLTLSSFDLGSNMTQ